MDALLGFLSATEARMNRADEECEDDGLAYLPANLYNRAWVRQGKEGLPIVGTATMCIVYLEKETPEKGDVHRGPAMGKVGRESVGSPLTAIEVTGRER
jgi:hypothetical protein